MAATAPILQSAMPVVWRDAATARDPFRFGWRTVRRERHDGTVECAHQPLTLEDLPHPEEEDFIVQGDTHRRWCRDLADVLDAQVSSESRAVVLCDCRIDRGVLGLRAHGPDSAVVFGLRARRNWQTFSVAGAGVLPEPEECVARAEQRADGEAAARAEAEAQAADLAAQLPAMEAEMGRLRGESS